MDFNFGLSFYAFYPRLKHGFLHSYVGAVVPTAVAGLAYTVFHMEVVGRRLFVAVFALGILVPLVQNILCAAEVAARIQAALMPL